MVGRNTFRKARETINYATAEDFQELFIDRTDSLYLFSFLLTAHPEKVERCFVPGIEDGAKGNRVFQEWARSWARRVIIRNAIREMSCAVDIASRASPRFAAGDDYDELALPEQLRPFARILCLPAFERFVFVLSVLDGYSDRECSLLLGVPMLDIQQTRKQVVLRMAEANESGKRRAADSETASPAFRLSATGVLA